MTTKIPRLQGPIDAMSVIHYALRAEAARVETLVGQLEGDGSRQPFRRAFYRRGMALAYHADTEDTYMTSLLPDAPAARECEPAHSRLAELPEDVQGCLTEEIGRTVVITRTQRHQFGKVVMARIARDDYLEEEGFVLPVVRRQISDVQQFAIARDLLLDEEAEGPRWYLDWLTDYPTPRERRLVADLAARAKEGCPDWPTELFVLVDRYRSSHETFQRSVLVQEDARSAYLSHTGMPSTSLMRGCTGEPYDANACAVPGHFGTRRVSRQPACRGLRPPRRRRARPAEGDARPLSVPYGRLRSRRCGPGGHSWPGGPSKATASLTASNGFRSRPRPSSTSALSPNSSPPPPFGAYQLLY